MNEKLLKTQVLFGLLDYEPFAVLLSLVAFSWLFYKIFLRDATPERHKGIHEHFRNLFRHTVWFGLLFLGFKFIHQADSVPFGLERTLVYLALGSFCWGLVVFVKTARLIILQYLFLGSMKSGVPILLVNIFSLLISIGLALWAASTLFGIQLGPLLATSAAFSIILGLALQDTLGNLFAGISLQLDHSFEIGDWLEVVNGVQRVVGQVQEITWRSTILMGWSDELITLPNRTMANSQLSNFHSGDQPIVRSQMIRLPYGVNTDLVREALRKSLKDVASVRQDLAPLIYVAETSESWLGFKVAYFIDSFGSQFRIGDEVLLSALRHLAAVGISPTPQILEVRKSESAA